MLVLRAYILDLTNCMCNEVHPLRNALIVILLSDIYIMTK